MDVLRQLLDPRDLAASRSTPLLAVLWLTGGLLMLAGVLLGPAGAAGRAPGVAVAVITVAVGVLLTAARHRVLAVTAYAALTMLGAGAITAAIAVAVPATAAAVGVVYVYVCVFSAVAVPRFAAGLIVVAAAGHAAVLAVIELPGWPAVWVLIWGVGSVTAVLVGRVLAGLRAAVAQRDEVVAELEQLDATKTAFLHAVHHELSRPLTVLRGATDLLDEHGTALAPEQRDELTRRAAVQARRLQGMLEDLLALGQMDQGGVPLAAREVEVLALLTDAVELSGLDPDRVDLVRCDLKVVRVDPVRVAHALANLLTNAGKYGGERTPIEVAVTAEPEQVVVTVDDQGPGIPPESREVVFAPFERAREEDRASGTGVGLAVVRAIARLHGGDAWAEQAPGGGARMCFSLRRSALEG